MNGIYIRAKDFLKKSYRQIILIDDTPHRIAGGAALGVFLGILPGAGPMAAVVLACVLHVNRAASLAASLLTNSWFSVVTFVLAVKIGAWATGSSWRQIYGDCKVLINSLRWNNIFDANVLNILKPVLIGYAVIGCVTGIVVYLTALVVLHEIRRRKEKKSLR